MRLDSVLKNHCINTKCPKKALMVPSDKWWPLCYDALVKIWNFSLIPAAFSLCTIEEMSSLDVAAHWFLISVVISVRHFVAAKMKSIPVITISHQLSLIHVQFSHWEQNLFILVMQAELVLHLGSWCNSDLLHTLHFLSPLLEKFHFYCSIWCLSYSHPCDFTADSKLQACLVFIWP